jgi:hypothetical protein
VHGELLAVWQYHFPTLAGLLSACLTPFCCNVANALKLKTGYLLNIRLPVTLLSVLFVGATELLIARFATGVKLLTEVFAEGD